MTLFFANFWPRNCWNLSKIVKNEKNWQIFWIPKYATISPKTTQIVKKCPIFLSIFFFAAVAILEFLQMDQVLSPCLPPSYVTQGQGDNKWDRVYNFKSPQLEIKNFGRFNNKDMWVRKLTE